MMKRILVIGIVLLSLLALTGVVCAAGTEGKLYVAGDVVSRSLELQINNEISSWVMQGGDNTRTGDNFINVTNDGFAQGYTVTVADKMDRDTDQKDKPDITPGYLVVYMSDNYGNWKWYDNRTYHSSNPMSLSNPLHILGEGMTDIALSGNDQVLYSTSINSHGYTESYSPRFKQTITTTDHAASDTSYQLAKGYMIIVTFTATPN
jgi:hypothetical protein